MTRRRGHPFSLPNVLTYLRILAVPAIVAILFWPREDSMRWWALGFYVAAAVTDYFDGYFARAWHQYSAIGRMLDPIADKLLVAATLLMLVADETIASFSIWAAIIILCREILVSGLREFLAELKRLGSGLATSPSGRPRCSLSPLACSIAGPAAR